MSGTPLPVIGAYSWVPQAPRGQVRDLRIRWALDEIGRDYEVEKVDVRAKPADITERQPFSQVPWYRDGDIELFESGAILLWIGQQSGQLIGEGEGDRARVLSWLFAALNSVEPFTLQLQMIAFAKDEEWAKLYKPKASAAAEKRLAGVAAHLDGREWLADAFSVADIAMATVLRGLPDPATLAGHPVLSAYLARCIERPAFKTALAAQLADFLPLDAPPAAAAPSEE